MQPTNHEDRFEELRINRWYSSGIPQRFLGEPDGGPCLDTSPLAVTSPALVERLRRRDGAGPESWLLFGAYGVGKTGLAVAYARQFVWPDGKQVLVDRPRSIGFVTLPDLLAELRATYRRSTRLPRRREGWGELDDDEADEPTEDDIIRRYRNRGLLILDDLGAEAVTQAGREWYWDRLYQLVGGRHNDGSATVFTSNLAPEQLGARLGERVMWRIVEMCGEDHIVRVEGPNLRRGRAS